MYGLVLTLAVIGANIPVPSSSEKAGSLKDAPVTLKVILPADAKLSFNGVPTRSTSAERTFVSPPLAAGKSYVYVARVEYIRDGKPVSFEKEILVSAGETKFVVLNAEETASKDGHAMALNTSTECSVLGGCATCGTGMKTTTTATTPSTAGCSTCSVSTAGCSSCATTSGCSTCNSGCANGSCGRTRVGFFGRRGR